MKYNELIILYDHIQVILTHVYKQKFILNTNNSCR